MNNLDLRRDVVLTGSRDAWNWRGTPAVQGIMTSKIGQRAVVRLAAAVVAIVGVVLTGGAAVASCFPTDVEADLESSDLVFVGVVTGLANQSRWATFRIEEVWKGDPVGDWVEVRAGPGGAPGAPAATSNDRTYVAGERYLVFASDLSRRPGAGMDFGEGARWVDGACSATRPHDSSLVRFRPVDDGRVSSESSGSPATAVILGVVMILAATAGVAIVLRRRSRAG
jgi:hypothetical protein